MHMNVYEARGYDFAARIDDLFDLRRRLDVRRNALDLSADDADVANCGKPGSGVDDPAAFDQNSGGRLDLGKRRCPGNRGQEVSSIQHDKSSLIGCNCFPSWYRRGGCARSRKYPGGSFYWAQTGRSFARNVSAGRTSPSAL